MISIDARWTSVSGMGTYLRHVIPGLIQHFSEKTIVLLGNDEELRKYDWSHAPNVRVRDFRAPMYSIREQWEFVRLIPHDTELHFATHYPIPLLYRGPLLVTIYDLFHLAMPAIVGGFHKRAYASFMFRAVQRKAAALITISRFTKDEFVRLVGRARQGIYPIHLGVDEEWFRIPPATSPHGKPYIIFVGNVKPHKNLTTLLEAFLSLKEGIPHDLIIVGKRTGFITGDTFPRRLLESLGNRLLFTGALSDDLLKQYVANADAMVFPSLYEGFGLPPLEAMAAGCPVLVSSAGAIPEVCGEAACYFDPHSVVDLANKLQGLLSDARIRENSRILGQAHARKFTWANCVQGTCKVIEGLLCGKIAESAVS
jgi:glycosyltransferase involved in cell wall biosynthesis